MPTFLERIFGVKEIAETRSQSPMYSIGDPGTAGLLSSWMVGIGEVDEMIALRQPALWRAVNLIAGTIASLPMRSFRLDAEGDDRVEVRSFLDHPAGPFPITRFQWVEMVITRLLLNGECGLQHIYNEGGALIGLWPTHPMSYQVRWIDGDKEFKVSQGGQVVTFTSADFTQLMGLTLDGLRGVSPLNIFRKNIQLAQAEQQAATKTMSNGMLVSGLASVDEDVDEDEARALKAQLDVKVLGPDNAGGIAMVNRRMKFTPWVSNNVDAQFLQSREFSVTEVARMYGVPPHLLAQLEKTTSFGTGLAENNAALAKFCLMHWTSRIEEALSALLPAPRFVEFDYSGLLQGTPADQINLLLAQMAGGLITPNEARRMQNLPPDQDPASDKLRVSSGPPIQDKKLPGEGGNKVFSRQFDASGNVDDPVTIEAHFHMDPGAVQVSTPVHIDPGAVQVSTPVNIARGAVQATINEAPESEQPTRRTTRISQARDGSLTATTEES